MSKLSSEIKSVNKSVVEIDESVKKLEYAVFGLEEDGGLNKKLSNLEDKLGRIYFALIGASLSLVVAAISISVSVAAAN